MPLYIVFTASADVEEHPIAEFDAADMEAAENRLNAEPDGSYRIVEITAERIVAKTPWGWVAEDHK